MFILIAIKTLKFDVFFLISVNLTAQCEQLEHKVPCDNIFNELYVVFIFPADHFLRVFCCTMRLNRRNIHVNLYKRSTQMTLTPDSQDISFPWVRFIDEFHYNIKYHKSLLRFYGGYLVFSVLYVFLHDNVMGELLLYAFRAGKMSCGNFLMVLNSFVCAELFANDRRNVWRAWKNVFF